MSSPLEHEDEAIETLARAIERLRSQNEHLAGRVDDLEDDLDQTETRLEALEDENQALRETNDQLRDRLDDCERATTRVDALADAARKRSGTNKRRIEELQARELEKGAHLLEATVDHCEIDVDGDRLEQLAKDDGRTYYRIPESEDPLDRDGTVALAHGDLLPIQQLARMDEEMLRSTSNSLPTRLAARLWRARTDSSVGDNPWERGCKGIKEYVKASDLKHWIRRQETGVSDTYAKKLVSRTIDALLDLSKNRLAVRRRTERKNGLEYTERRIVLPAAVDVPGETPPSSGTTEPRETAGVHG